MNMEFSCQEAVPMIGAYLDGELSPARAALLRPHLLECPACRNAAADGRSLQRWCEPLRESAASGELAVAVPTISVSVVFTVSAIAVSADSGGTGLSAPHRPARKVASCRSCCA